MPGSLYHAASAAFLVIVATLAFAGSSAAAPAISGQLLVGFEKGVSKDRQERILAAADGRIAQRFSAVRDGRLVVVRPRRGTETKPLRKRLRRADGIAYAEPDFIYRESKTPDDPFYTLDYGLVDQPDDHDVDAPAAWTTRTALLFP